MSSTATPSDPQLVTVRRRYRTHGRRVLDISGSDALFSYSRDVDDYEAFLTESIFYHLAFGHVRGRRSDLSFVEVYERLRFALDYLLIDPDRHSLANPLLAAVFAE